MKKLILLLTLSASTYAEPIVIPYEAICDDTKTIIGKLKESNESPYVIGNTLDNAGTTMLVWINNYSEEKEWTITASKGKITCIIGTGRNLKLLSPKPTT